MRHLALTLILLLPITAFSQVVEIAPPGPLSKEINEALLVLTTPIGVPTNTEEEQTAFFIPLMRNEEGFGSAFCVYSDDADGFSWYIGAAHTLYWDCPNILYSNPYKPGINRPKYVRPVEIIKSDAVSDLCLLRAKGLSKRMRLRSTEVPEEAVITQLGWKLIKEPKATMGLAAGPCDDTGMMRITCPPWPGMSGGPVFDVDGLVCGVVIALQGPTDKNGKWIRDKSWGVYAPLSHIEKLLEGTPLEGMNKEGWTYTPQKEAAERWPDFHGSWSSSSSFSTLFPDQTSSPQSGN